MVIWLSMNPAGTLNAAKMPLNRGYMKTMPVMAENDSQKPASVRKAGFDMEIIIKDMHSTYSRLNFRFQLSDKAASITQMVALMMLAPGPRIKLYNNSTEASAPIRMGPGNIFFNTIYIIAARKDI